MARKKPEYEGAHRADATPKHMGQRPYVVKPGHGEGDTRREHKAHHRPGAAHAAPAPKRTRKAAAPASVAPASSPPARTGPSTSDRTARRVARAGVAARDIANRRAFAQQSGKPSVTGSAVGGAAAGTAAGATVGGPVGAAVGAGVGAVGGAASGLSKKRAYKALMRPHPVQRKALVAEFLVCMIVLSLSPLTDKNRSEPATAYMKRATALMLLFVILGMVSSAGRNAARFAAAFGALITVVFLFSERDLLTNLTVVLGRPASGTSERDAAEQADAGLRSGSPPPPFTTPGA